ncbi:MAG: hypothetical protein KTV68_05165 [Acidimicrobiia bacterium]|nr:hypothetical protein [Acidimicrobiia bacterium]MCY4435242.1 DUF6338 family protein [bacterium]
MPTTVLSLAIVGLIVVPGLSYRAGRESRYPTQKVRGFRETASITFAGIVSVIAGLVVFGIIRAAVPSHSPDVGALLRTPGSYTREQLPYLSAWVLAVLAISSVGAYFFGRLSPRLPSNIAVESAWWSAFESIPDHNEMQIYVDCYLVDDSVLSGYLYSYSVDIEETMDRELCLVAPVGYRAAKSLRTEELEDAGIITISAARIKFVVVTYFDVDEEDYSPDTSD